MLAALSLLAAIAVGPEQTLPATPTQPVTAYRAVVAPIDNDFFVAWRGPNISVQRVGRATTTGTFIAESPKSSTIAIASNGTDALVAWSDANALHVALIDADAKLLRSSAIPTANRVTDLVLTAIGNRYLGAWSSGYGVTAIFIDPITAERDGKPFLVSPAGGTNLTAASNGRMAFIAFNRLDELVAATISGSGTTSLIDVDRRPQGERVTWDGTSFVVAEISRPFLRIAAFDGDGKTTQPAGSVATLNGPSFTNSLGLALAPNGHGSTLFYNDAYGTPYAFRLAPGGAPLDPAPQLWLHLADRYDRFYVDDAAFNGSATFVVSSRSTLRGAVAGSFTVTPPLALRAPSQSTPAIAAGDTLLFTGSGEDGPAYAARWKDGAFLDERIPVGEGVVGMAAEHDRAAIVTMLFETNARFLDADGRVSVPIALDEGGFLGPLSFAWIDGVAPLGDGTFITFTTSGIVGPEILADAQGSSAATVGNGGAIALEYIATPFYYGSAVAPGLIVSVGRTIHVVTIDPLLRVTGAPIDIDDDHFDRLAIATDGGTHALLATNHSVFAIDLAARTAVRRDDMNGSAPHLAWDGDAFILATDDLKFATYARDGTRLTEPFTVSTPTPPHDVAIASGSAGTAIVYLRNAHDLGLGDTDRMMLRTITKLPPRHHAAHH